MDVRPLYGQPVMRKIGYSTNEDRVWSEGERITWGKNPRGTGVVSY